MDPMEQMFEYKIDKLIMEHHDDTVMPLPDLEFEPHQLISKVRKHYMDYIIKLLSINYENNRKLVKQNDLYLPSAIWRCAKDIETSAAYACMVVQIYRKNIVAMIKNLNEDSSKGKLNKILYGYLIKPPENDKKLQTDSTLKDCGCICTCDQRKKRRSSVTPKHNDCKASSTINGASHGLTELKSLSSKYSNTQCSVKDSFLTLNEPCNVKKDFTNEPNLAMGLETDQADDLMSQLEKLFQGDNDDLFDGALYDNTDNCDEISRPDPDNILIKKDNLVKDNLAIQNKPLNERLATFPTLINSNSIDTVNINKKSKKHNSNKWICEEYYLKIRLFELLDQIGDVNRRKLVRIKERLLNLFGDDSDDEGVISPMEESPEFIISCKERIAPWVVKLLTPFYIKGRIRNKALFKLLAKHLIKLIYQCSPYPQEYEVYSFVSDFLQNHKMIRCEADFLQFRIDNL